MAQVGKKVTRSEQTVKQESPVQPFLTIGTVVDTNDPQQQGRLRIVCEAWGDTKDKRIVNIPWAMYCSPFAGTMPCGVRGPDPGKSVTEGAVSYGMFAIPKVGAQVFVMCLDGNPSMRVWIGSAFGQFLTHTLPMGRFFSEGSEGPFSSTEKTIEPIATNLRTAFGDIKNTHEGKTRGVEQQIGAINEQQLGKTVSKVADEFSPQRRGYQSNRLRPDLDFDDTGGNFDPQMYCITTPGLHMLVMDDSDTNGRIRLRSTSGNQIILDDTNERIYVSTSDGKNWIEMDRNGNIDIYSERRLSIHAEKDINFKTEGAFRVTAGSIHLNAEGDVRSYSGNNLHLRAVNNVNVCGDTANLEGTSNLNLYTTGDWKGSGKNVSLNSAEDMSFGVVAIAPDGGIGIGTVSEVLNLRVVETIPPIPGPLTYELQLHSMIWGITVIGPTGKSVPLDADSACGSTLYAWSANRVPDHEPWSRVMSTATDFDDSVNNSSTLELSYDSSQVGFVELGESITRNPNWRR